MPKVIIDDKAFEVPEGQTVLKACLDNGISVPYFCYHPKLSIAGNCRMCLVEIEGRPKLEISCNTVVQEGMVVRTKTAQVLEARQAVLEFILINHPLDCPICDQAGECQLQDQYFGFSGVRYRFREEKVHKPKAVPLGPFVLLDDERCIMCTRCIRFCDEVAHSHELGMTERGDRTTLRIFTNEGMKNPYSLNTVDICPVGALTSRDFRFNKRVWFLQSTNSICTGCATGCNIYMDHHQGVVYRYRPRENEAVNQCWMCDEGRLTYKFINAADRVLSPYVKTGREWVRTSWDEAIAKLADVLKNVAPSGRGVVLSAQCSNEENKAWWRLANETWTGAHLFSTRRQPPNPSEDNFLRHADKNPNGRCLHDLKAQKPYGGGCKFLVVLDTLTQQEIEVLEKDRPEFVVVLASNWGVNIPPPLRGGGKGEGEPHPLPNPPPSRGREFSAWADMVLPLATFAEQSGTFTNVKGIVQAFERAIAPMGESMSASAIAARFAACEGYNLQLSSTGT